jgi:hypothetical protein
MKITAAKLIKAKKGLKDGKTLVDIIKDDKLDIAPAELNKHLMKKYGTDGVGNPMRRETIKARASHALEAALLELPKDDVIATLEEFLAELKK